ncbi:MAG: GTP cyclohydrolase II RibA [Beijerinckiaceae bacterium]
MRHPREIFGSRLNLAEVSVERALAEFRSARPVVITEGDEAILMCGVEGLDAEAARDLDNLAEGRARLVLPAARLRRLGLDRQQPGVVSLPAVDSSRIEALALKIEAKVDAPVSPVTSLDEVALELARLSLTIPAIVTMPIDLSIAPESLFARVTADAVRGFRQAQVKAMTIVGRAPVPLEHAPETEFVVFRGGEGLRDQVAIIVGKPDFAKPVPVRMHSACLTGDLFGSLKCDCGDQLRETVTWMAKNGGGILLYLDQEGRGNGISNKMRAYKLQSQGWDTYDADEVLGFDLDQRKFDFAAVMLTQLGVTQVSLMTNNPEKIGSLKKAGIELVESKRVLGRPNPNNVRYLASKRDRAGHLIDFEALAARTPAE